jgi:GNAT superfamily N-acetyltransferase
VLGWQVVALRVPVLVGVSGVRGLPLPAPYLCPSLLPRRALTWWRSGPIRVGMSDVLGLEVAGFGVRGLPAGLRVVMDPSASQLEEAAWLAVAVSEATGFPDPAGWPGGSLAVRMRERQVGAVRRLVVVDDGAGGAVVAQGLISVAADPMWGEVAEVAEAYAAGTLVELNGLLVDVRWQRHGVGWHLYELGLAVVDAAGWVACATVWDGGVSRRMLEGRDRWVLLGWREADATGQRLLRFVRRGAAEVSPG